MKRSGMRWKKPLSLRGWIPTRKSALFLALKKRGHVVGYMGDGINDAPSLHSADVGISVANAVDVAKGSRRPGVAQAGFGCSA